MNEAVSGRRAQFRTFQESTREDWDLIASNFIEYAAALPGRVLAHLRLLQGDYGGFPVDRLHHSLLAATLAHKAGEEDEYVVCALLHDIGDTLGTYNHPDIAAAILKPFVSEANQWMVQHHGIFQGYYFFHHLGLDRNLRDRFRGHPHFEQTRLFCERYDNPAFDPERECRSLEFFEPMLRKVLTTPRESIYLKA